MKLPSIIELRADEKIKISDYNPTGQLAVYAIKLELSAGENLDFFRRWIDSGRLDGVPFPTSVNNLISKDLIFVREGKIWGFESCIVYQVERDEAYTEATITLTSYIRMSRRNSTYRGLLRKNNIENLLHDDDS